MNAVCTDELGLMRSPSPGGSSRRPRRPSSRDTNPSATAQRSQTVRPSADTTDCVDFAIVLSLLGRRPHDAPVRSSTTHLPVQPWRRDMLNTSGNLAEGRA